MPPVSTTVCPDPPAVGANTSATRTELVTTVMSGIADSATASARVVVPALTARA